MRLEKIFKVSAEPTKELAPGVSVVGFASGAVTRTPVPGSVSLEGKPLTAAPAGSPESLSRFQTTTPYELSGNALFKDLFARRLGSKGICGGYGRFGPGASLPCHTHKY